MGRGGGLSCYNMKSLTMGNVFRECHTTSMPKTFFVIFEEKKQKNNRLIAAATRLNFSFLPNSPYFFSGSQKSLTWLANPFPHFYIDFIYCLACSHPEYS